jgi:hypothetical protein
MKQHLIVGCGIAVMMAALCGCSSMGSTVSAVSAFEKLGGSSNLTSIASGFVNSSLKDPRLSGLTAGKTIDATAATGKVSNQLCAMLGGGCQAPLTDSQLSAAASKVSPDQSKAISENFGSALNSVVSDPTVRELVTKTVGSKLPGVLGGLL